MPKCKALFEGGSLYRTQGLSSELSNLGFHNSPSGDRWNIQNLGKQRLFRSDAPSYASVVAVLDDEAAKILISRESPSEPANVYRIDLAGKAEPVALTAFEHPTPQLKDVKKQ